MNTELPSSSVGLLDTGFLPAKTWNTAYAAEAERHPQKREVVIALEQPQGSTTVVRRTVLPATPEFAARNALYFERLVKFLLWSRGGSRIIVAGAPDVAQMLQKTYSESGNRAFDWDFIGRKIYREAISIRSVSLTEAPEERQPTIALGRHMQGCRIGFDLGGSDRKTSAVIDGKVVFTEEVPWDPYFQKDPNYHLEGIRHSLRRAAEHLPKVDAIGGSAAGCYVANEVRAASLFRGVAEPDFENRVRGIFRDLKAEWGNVPFEVVNDGEVTALAGSMSLSAHSVLGISMGTSLAAGYVDQAGCITTWINELAFAPVDYRLDGPRDEWSGDIGCGVQFFSQQGVARLAPLAGLQFEASMPFAERLVAVQERMKAGDERAASIYRTIGHCFGHSLAHYADFYPLENVLILGRVTSGSGGEMILSVAGEVIAKNYPHLGNLKLSTPDEQMKRHGQAVAAASLPALVS